MKVFSEALLKEVEQQLYAIHAETAETLVVAEQAIKLLISVLDTLKSQCLNHQFENKKEEIDFFKNSKPQFTAKLIYYNEIYTIESKKPVGTTKEIRKYYKEEWMKLKLFFKQHSEMYRYLRTGNNSLDKKYFLRGKTHVKHIQDSNYWQADHRFCTSHDFQVAKIIANEQLAIYFEKAISKPENKIVNGTDSRSKKTQKWTAPKVALIELIYALHTEGVFNNGTSDLIEVTSFFEEAFSIELGQFYRTFLEIRSRKSDRTKFINSLKEKLILRMDTADENKESLSIRKGITKKNLEYSRLRISCRRTNY